MKNVREIEGDLLDIPENIWVIAHQANTENVMGAGIAAQIVKRFPEMKEADDTFHKYARNNNIPKLGLLSVGHKEDYKGKPLVLGYNLYAQTLMKRDGILTRYDALECALYNLAREADMLFQTLKRKVVIGFPHGMGCGIGGGKWSKVKKMIVDAFRTQCEKDEIEIVIVKYNG